MQDTEQRRGLEFPLPHWIVTNQTNTKRTSRRLAHAREYFRVGTLATGEGNRLAISGIFAKRLFLSPVESAERTLFDF